MLPARKIDLWADAEGDLRSVEGLVAQRLLADAGSGWTEIVREYADDLNYLSLSLMKSEREGITLQIEFGVRGGEDSHATGVLSAQWLDAEAVQGVGALEVVAVDGGEADVSLFATKLESYLDLPLVIADQAA